MPSDIFELQGEKMGARCRVAEALIKRKKKYLECKRIDDEIKSKEKSV